MKNCLLFGLFLWGTAFFGVGKMDKKNNNEASFIQEGGCKYDQACVEFMSYIFKFLPCMQQTFIQNNARRSELI